MCIVFELGRVVNYYEGLATFKEHNPLHLWSRIVMWQIKNISPLLECLWSPTLPGWWHTGRDSHPQIRMTSQWGDLVRSLDKLSAFCTCMQPMDTKLGKVLTSHEKISSLKPRDLLFTWSMWGHVKSLKVYISTFVRFIATKFGR